MADWSSLRVVLNIHRAGSMSAAARILQVIQPTLSRQLSRVEHDLGLKLFDRRHGRLVATEAGLIVTQHAEKIERQLRGMEDSLRDIDNEMSGIIRISAPQQLLPFKLGDILCTFQASYPDITFDISVSDTIADFSSDNVDIVFRAEENPKPSLWGYRIERFNLNFFGHKDLLARFGGNTLDIPLAEGLPLIVHDGFVVSSQNETQKKFPGGRIVLSADSLETSAAFVAHGLGVARLPEFVGRSLPNVEKVQGVASPIVRSLWILTHHELRDVVRIRRFIEFVAEKTADDNDERVKA